jgi:hypothetical protein
MSQLIWMIDLIPNWFWTLVLWAGVLAVVASYVLGKLPFVAQYRIPLRVGGVIAVIVGVYFFGVIANEEKWQARVEELQRQVREAEVEGETANEKLGKALEEKKTVIVERGRDIVKYVDRFKDREVLKTVEGPERVKIEKVIEYVERCPVPKELVDAHNQAAVPPTGGKK